MSSPQRIFGPEEIPPAGPICIYGAGQLGTTLYEALQDGVARRVRLFADAFKSGVIAGRPVVSPSSFVEECSAGEGWIVLLACRDVEGAREALGTALRHQVFDASPLADRMVQLKVLADLREEHADLCNWKRDYISWSQTELKRRADWLEAKSMEIRALQVECFGPPQALAKPPRFIPEEMLASYSMGDSVPIEYSYDDSSYPANYPLVYDDEEVDFYLEKIRRGQTFYYGKTDELMMEILNRHPIEGMEIAVIGSRTPWYESMCLSQGGTPITIDYNPILARSQRLKTVTSEEFRQRPSRFDRVLCVSSIEHSGLGRYGDPLDPDGDLKAMTELGRMLNPGGILFLTVPVGPDRVIFNLHRIYGPQRLPKLLSGWERLEVAGWDGDHRSPVDCEPVFLLRKT
jgi:SAM-dependent methyltransferase